MRQHVIHMHLFRIRPILLSLLPSATGNALTKTFVIEGESLIIPVISLDSDIKLGQSTRTLDL
jgi:hypothetical protein